MPKPPILLVNTGVLLASSVALEFGAPRAEGGRAERVQPLVDASAPRSAWLFLGGQAWRGSS